MIAITKTGSFSFKPSSFIKWQFEKYTGPLKEEGTKIANAFDKATEEEIRLYNEAITEVQQIEELWRQKLEHESNWWLFSTKSLDKIKQESKNKREETEIRIGIYFGKLLMLGAFEEELELFLNDLLRLELSLRSREELDCFSEGFTECFNSNRINFLSRYSRLSNFCSNYMDRLFPRFIEDGNPYASPGS